MKTFQQFNENVNFDHDSFIDDLNKKGESLETIAQAIKTMFHCTREECGEIIKSYVMRHLKKEGFSNQGERVSDNKAW